MHGFRINYIYRRELCTATAETVKHIDVTQKHIERRNSANINSYQSTSKYGMRHIT